MTVAPMVDVSLEMAASPDTVWSILTTPAGFSAWMDGIVSFEARTGSPFRAEFPAYQTVIAGEIVTLDPEARHLGVTWGVESGHQADVFPAGCSLVEVRVHDSKLGCLVELKHSRLPESLAAEQEGGWRFHLSRMALKANRIDLAAGLERTLAGWFSAWNEPDEAARLALLHGCCAEDVEFRDDWAVASGIDLLSQHIANCFRFMPGWQIEQTGETRICRGEALVGWRSSGPGGVSLEGHNHVTADPDGTLRKVTGFQSS